MTEETSDLGVILPSPVTLSMGGKEVEVKRIKVKQIVQVMAAIQPFYNELKELGIKRGSLNDEEVKARLLAFFMTNGEDLFSLMAILSDQPLEFIEELDLDEAVILLTAILEVNLDFFIQKVLPSISQLMASLVDSPAQTQQSGQIPSNS